MIKKHEWKLKKNEKKKTTRKNQTEKG